MLVKLVKVMKRKGKEDLLVKRTVAFMMVNFNWIKKMVMEYLLGPVVRTIRESGRMIKKMVMGHILMPMVLNMWESGRMVKNLVKEHSLKPMVQSITAANG